MKTKTIEKWLLLEQTGELSPRRRRLLNASAEAQKKRDELNALRRVLPESNPELSPWMVAKIEARLRTERRVSAGFSNVWKPALALAACLALIVGVVNTFHGNTTSSASAVAAAAIVAAPPVPEGVDVWSVPNEEDLDELERLIVAISYEPFDIMEM